MEPIQPERDNHHPALLGRHRITVHRIQQTADHPARVQERPRGRRGPDRHAPGRGRPVRRGGRGGAPGRVVGSHIRLRGRPR